MSETEIKDFIKDDEKILIENLFLLGIDEQQFIKQNKTKIQKGFLQVQFLKFRPKIHYPIIYFLIEQLAENELPFDFLTCFPVLTAKDATNFKKSAFNFLKSLEPSPIPQNFLISSQELFQPTAILLQTLSTLTLQQKLVQQYQKQPIMHIYNQCENENQSQEKQIEVLVLQIQAQIEKFKKLVQSMQPKKQLLEKCQQLREKFKTKQSSSKYKLKEYYENLDRLIQIDTIKEARNQLNQIYQKHKQFHSFDPEENIMNSDFNPLIINQQVDDQLQQQNELSSIIKLQAFNEECQIRSKVLDKIISTLQNI